MLVYFEPAGMGDIHGKDLVLAPLPFKKQFWEANNAQTWRSEIDRDPEAIQSAIGLASNGNLVKINGDGSHTYCRPDIDIIPPAPPLNYDYPYDYNFGHESSLMSPNYVETTVKWEEWCAGMDSFGGLIMLAASLVT